MKYLTEFDLVGNLTCFSKNRRRGTFFLKLKLMENIHVFLMAGFQKVGAGLKLYSSMLKSFFFSGDIISRCRKSVQTCSE